MVIVSEHISNYWAFNYTGANLSDGRCTKLELNLTLQPNPNACAVSLLEV